MFSDTEMDITLYFMHNASLYLIIYIISYYNIITACARLSTYRFSALMSFYSTSIKNFFKYIIISLHWQSVLKIFSNLR